MVRQGEMMKKLVIAAAALVGLASLPAAGADMAPIMKAPPPAPGFSWVGCYLGVSGGGAFGHSSVRNDGFDGPFAITNSYNIKGGIIGGTSGCNLVQEGAWVFGVESDLSWSGKKGSAQDLPFYNAFELANNTTRERWLATGRARVGYAVNNWMFYVTGGYAAAGQKYTVTSPFIFAGSFAETHTVSGWVAGLGFEWMFMGNWSAKFEYLYADFGRTPYFATVDPIPPSSIFFANRQGGISMNDHIVRVGLNYKFY